MFLQLTGLYLWLREMGRVGARTLRSMYPLTTRVAIICDNFSPHLSTRKDRRVGTWTKANNVEIAYTPTNSS